MKLWTVTLPWGQEDEGTYTTYVRALNADDAVLLAAAEMAECSDAPEFDDPDEARLWIQERADAALDVCATLDRVLDELARVFANQLFPDGVARQLDGRALLRVLTANRGILVPGANARKPPQHYRITVSGAAPDTTPIRREGPITELPRALADVRRHCAANHGAAFHATLL